MKLRAYIFLAAALSAAMLLTAVNASAQLKPKDDPRTAWWQNDKFGMFIHWGVYAVPADSSKGIAEWYTHNHKIPVPEYERFTARVNANTCRTRLSLERVVSC